MLESAAEITYIGAGKATVHLYWLSFRSNFVGIQVSPNSSRILRKLGVDKFIEKYVTEPIDLKMMRWEDGKILVEVPLKESAHNEYGSPYWYVRQSYSSLRIITGCLGISTGLTYTAGYSSVQLNLASRCILTAVLLKLTHTDPLLSRRTGKSIRPIWLSRLMVRLPYAKFVPSY